jgi:NAD(P)-dependent dehydrogenase (short-subunit alcohol dehydrogenase family)
MEIAAAIDAQAGGESALTFVHDVRDVQAVPDLFQEIATRLGGLDLVVYAAGIMPPVGPEEYPTTNDLAVIEANFAGAVAWLNQAANRFGRARAGTIVGISSVAGDRGRLGNPVYNASKAGLDTYLEALRARLARRGVTVLTAKPGYVRTALIEGVALPRSLPVISAERAAELILKAAAEGERVAYVPGWWRLIMTVVRAIPAPIFERLNL